MSERTFDRSFLSPIGTVDQAMISGTFESMIR